MNWPAGFQLPWQSSRVALATLVTLAYIRLALGEHDHVGSRQRADAARYVGHQVLGDAQVRPPGGVEGGLVVVTERKVGNGFNHQSLDKGCHPLTHIGFSRVCFSVWLSYQISLDRMEWKFHKKEETSLKS